MNKDKRYINIVSIILIIVLIISISTFIIIKKSKVKTLPIVEEEIPTIKEEYETTSLDEYSRYDTNVYVDKESNEIRLTSDEDGIDYYILGKTGIMYVNPVSVEKDEKENEIETYGNFKIMFDSDSEKFYYINSKSKIISDLYDIIKPIYYENNIVHYLLLINDNENYLLNINTYDLTVLNNEIKEIVINNGTYQIGNEKYLIYIDSNDLYGLIDFEGNIILEASYQELLQYNTSTTYIAKKNNKYGIIDNKNNIVLNFDYKNITYSTELENYTIVQKNNSLGILYNNEIIVNYSIDYNTYDIFDYFIKDNSLYINIDSSKNNNKLYKINTKGIEKVLDGKFYEIKNYNDELVYFYKINEYNSELLLYIYDTDLFEYYNTIIEYKKQYDYLLTITNIENTDYYRLDILYDLDTTSEDQNIYIDLRNSKLINEINALYKYFDNGYGFTLDENGNLNIYKKEELLSSYKNIDEYLGGYYFLSKQSDNIIKKIEFKKESK